MMKEILLIDDDPIINLINTRLIKQRFPNAVINTFANGLDGLNHMLAERHKEYIIFLDINMPIMNGWEFLNALKETYIPFNMELYILTSSIDQADKDHAKKYDLVNRFISKPLHKDVLEEILQVSLNEC